MNEIDNLEEMERFLGKFNLPRLNQEETEIITSTEMEAVTDYQDVKRNRLLKGLSVCKKVSDLLMLLLLLLSRFSRV